MGKMIIISNEFMGSFATQAYNYNHKNLHRKSPKAKLVRSSLANCWVLKISTNICIYIYIYNIYIYYVYIYILRIYRYVYIYIIIYIYYIIYNKYISITYIYMYT